MEFTFILKRAALFLFSAALVALSALALFIDVKWLNDTVQEISVTEVAQELILAAIVAIFIFLAIRDRASRNLSILIAGFFGCMLIREMDFAFDALAHGAWVWFALLTTLVSLLFALRKPRDAASQLAQFLRHPACGMMMAGLLSVLVFSRLFGIHLLWQNLMQESYLRLVKNMVEEGIELFGYTLCLVSSLWYAGLRIARDVRPSLRLSRAKQSHPHSFFTGAAKTSRLKN